MKLTITLNITPEQIQAIEYSVSGTFSEWTMDRIREHLANEVMKDVHDCMDFYRKSHLDCECGNPDAKLRENFEHLCDTCWEEFSN
jgi:hypothetical protein